MPQHAGKMQDGCPATLAFARGHGKPYCICRLQSAGQHIIVEQTSTRAGAYLDVCLRIDEACIAGLVLLVAVLQHPRPIRRKLEKSSEFGVRWGKELPVDGQGLNRDALTL